MDKVNTTLVSGFLSDINNIKYRNVDKYIEYGKKLIDIRLPKVIFIDKQIYQQYFLDISDELTKFIEIEKKDLYFYEHIDKLTNFKLNTDNPNKDTVEYMFFQNHKTEWIRQAIQLDFFKTSQYIWIDFGIYHIIKDDDLFEKYMYNLRYKTHDNIRIPGCWNPYNTKNTNIFYNISWYFAGGIFGGNKDKLLEFADLTKQKCIFLMNNCKHIMWEVNMWYLVFLDNINFPNNKIFNWYVADHNSSMLLGY